MPHTLSAATPMRGSCPPAANACSSRERDSVRGNLAIMASSMQTISAPAPPDFAEARNRRQKARAAGLNPDYWYAVEYDRAVKRGQAVEVRFWNSSIVL